LQRVAEVSLIGTLPTWMLRYLRAGLAATCCEPKAPPHALSGQYEVLYCSEQMVNRAKIRKKYDRAGALRHLIYWLCLAASKYLAYAYTNQWTSPCLCDLSGMQQLKTELASSESVSILLVRPTSWLGEVIDS